MRSTTTKTVARAFTDFFHRRKILLSSSYLPQPYRSLYSTSATTATTRTRTKVISVLQGNDVRGIGGCHYCYKYPSSTISSRCNYSSSRYNSSSSSNNKSKNKNKRFDLQALPFSISPEEALESFRKWAENDQGLRYLMSYNSVRIGAAYVPVWSFDLNIRFKQQQQQQQQQYSWKPPIFQAYDRGGQQKKNKQQGVIYLPGGLSAYSGYSYRRSLINPVHSTTLIFMGEQTQPFGGWMLNDMVLKETGNPIPVIPDAWNSTQGRAFSVVKEELQEIVDEAWINEKYDNNNDDDIPPPTVQTQVVTARRVLMPTFVIEYNILGLEYTAFVSGCDRSAPVGGVSHRIFESNNDNTIGGLSPEFHRSSQNILTQLSSGASQLIRKMNLPILVGLLRPFFTILWFVFIRLLSITPVIGVAGGLFTGFRKILQPWMDNRKASADWERQRQHEAEMVEDADNDTNNKSNMNDFTDYSGTARAHFNKNKDEILRSLSGDAKHQEGDFDWYSDWEAWAQQQWKQQASQQQQQQQQKQSYYSNQQQQYQQQQSQQQQRQSKATKSKKYDDNEYKWPFDINNPYSILGIDRYATDSEVSNAFRKEMLQYHPDTQPNASDAQKRRFIERSKHITNAYRTIKTDRKKAKGGRTNK